MVAGERYTIMLWGKVPDRAITPEAGLYLDGKRIAALKAEDMITAAVPACSSDKLRLELRTGGWVPQQVNPGSKDPRTLGIQLSRLTMRSASGGNKTFDANTGTWVSP